jgi:hypothetical protein
MQDFKNRFKDAIDNEGKVFYIKAHIIKEKVKKEQYVLFKIEPLKD